MATVDIKDAHKYVQDRWPKIEVGYRIANPGMSLILTCVYRTPEEQAKLYAMGRTMPGKIVTNVDGTTKKSNHNYKPSRAIDVAVLVAGKVSWDVKNYLPLGALAKAHGLVWGGDWKTFKDYPHLELPKEVV